MVKFEVLVFQVFAPMLSAFFSFRGMSEDSGDVIVYRDIVQWIRDHSDAVQNPGVRLLLKEQDVESPQADNFGAKIDTKYMAQAFRAVMALRVGFPEDKRVWGYAHSLSVQYVKSSAWTSSFFLTLVKVKHNPGRGGFYTTIATTWERLLFLMAVKVLEDFRQERLPSYIWSGTDPRTKRRRTNVPIYFVRSFKWTRDNAQRIGYAVQCIVRGWDRFAQSVNFRDVEDLVAPYIRYDSSTMAYVPISNASQGFARLAQRTSLLGELGPTNDENLCGSEVSSRPEAMDTALRSFASSFLDDIWSTVCFEGLYTMVPGNDIEKLKDLRSAEDDEMVQAPRFQEFNISALESAATSESVPPPPSVTDDIPYSRKISASRHRRPGKTRAKVSTAIVEISDSDEDEITPAPVPEQPAARESPIQPEPVLRGPGSSPLDAPIPEQSCAGGEDCPCFQARARLEDRMGQYVRMYDCSFEKVLETDDLCSDGASAEQEVHLVLTDPPFNHRRESGRSNSDHDKLSSSQLKKAVEVVDQLLISGGSAVIFTSPIQFRDWHKALKTVPGEGVMNVDPHPITMVNRPGHYFGKVGKMTMAFFPVTAWAVHAHKTGLSPQDAFKLVDYTNHSFVPSRHPAWTNVLDDVERLKADEILRGRSENGSLVQMRPEQKSRELLKELISRLTKPGALVADIFAGTFSTAAACLSLPRHRKFIGCEVRSDVFNAARHKLVEVFAEAIVNKDSDIVFKSQDVINDARLVVAHSGGGIIRDPEWRPPPGFPALQSVPLTLLRSLAVMCGNPRLPEEYDGVPVSRWPKSLKGTLLSTSAQTLEAMEAVVTGVCVAKSTIRHSDAGDGVFAMRGFSQGQVIGYYFGALVYDDIGNRRQKTKTYGESGELGVTVAEFNKYKLAISIPSTGLVIGEETACQLFIVPSKFCPLRKINDPRYLEGDEDIQGVELGEVEKRFSNVRVSAPRVRSVKEASKHSLVQVECVRDIRIGEELFFDYGPDYF